jgi:phosphoribosylformimino-5-aminoimidazole carboxamide ribotide isomerase
VVVIPAIDVLGGRCVRLRLGEYADTTVYEDDPADAARNFLDAGASRIHVVDLDAARGLPLAESADAVRRIVGLCRGAGCDVQVGGGVRSVDGALTWLNAGASLVVLGSVAARDPELANAICEATEGRVLLGLDVRAGVARVQGWTAYGLMTATELVTTWREWRAAGIVYTDTTRDGLMTGPDLEGLRTYRELYAGPVFVSGGISSLADISACAAAGAVGVVVGKALYEGRIDLVAALHPLTNPA